MIPYPKNLLQYDNGKVTLELRDIIEAGIDIWNFEYPSFYQGEDKKAFEKKVIGRYYFRQIGQETTGRFLHYFRQRILEIMPYYVKLYDSIKLMDELENPFDNLDIVETFEQHSTGEMTGQSSAESSSSTNVQETNEKIAAQDTEHRFSNTPQGSIQNLDNYLTEASRDGLNSSEDVQSEVSSSSEGSSSGSSSESSSGTITHTLTRKGNQGVNTYAHDIMEYRKTLLNIDQMIIDELQDLFLKIY